MHAPWGGEPRGLPINARIYRKKSGKTHRDLVEGMIRELAAWFPDREFHLCGDGAYAPRAGRNLPRTHVTSRMRRDAALYELPAPRHKASAAGRERRAVACPPSRRWPMP